jgi:hypothetical protein
VLEQVANAAADQLHGARRQNPGFHHDAQGALGEIRGLGRRLDDRRHAREQRRRQLFQHAPDREVERVDVHRGALKRHTDVLADEGAGPGEGFEPAIHIHPAVGKLACALACINEQGADAPVDINPGITLGRPGGVGQLVELVLVFTEEFRERFEQTRSLVKRQPPQVGAAHFARVRQHGAGDTHLQRLRGTDRQSVV